MCNLTRAQALKHLKPDYWYGPRFDQIASLSPDIAAELCDTGVNMGPHRGVKNASTLAERFQPARGNCYPGYGCRNGRIGPRTINALRAYLQNRGRDGERER